MIDEHRARRQRQSFVLPNDFYTAVLLRPDLIAPLHPQSTLFTTSFEVCNSPAAYTLNGYEALGCSYYYVDVITRKHTRTI
jgi:hypothetical protein